jgi:hypothetical protein
VGSPKDWLRLARVPLAPTAAFDSVACALLARGPGFARVVRPDSHVPGHAGSLSVQDGLLLAATSLLVYVAGMTTNDVVDRRRDATIHPERPRPSGRISPAAAIAFAVLCAAGAIAIGGGPAGERLAVGAALLCAVGYDVLPRRLTAAGCALMGGTRAANAATGVLPLVVAGLTHPLALAGPLLIGLYSAGITAHSASEGRQTPRPANTLFMRVASFVVFAGAGALSLLGADGVALGVYFAAFAALSVAFVRVPRKGPVRAQVLELLLGFYLLGAILASGGFPPHAWLPVLCAFAAAYLAILGSQLFVRALRPR